MVTRPLLSSFEWKLDHNSTTEGQVFYVMDRSGLFAVVQLVYSSMNTWAHNLQISARIHLPSGLKKSLSFSHSASTFKITKDRLSCECHPIGKVTKHETGLGYNIHFKADGIDINLQLVATDGAVQLKPHQFTQDESGGSLKSSIIPHATVTGNIIVEGDSYDIVGSGAMVLGISFLTILKLVKTHLKTL